MKKTDSLELADLLRRSIINGEYKPRERLVETELARKFSVSRTPVREALKHLEALGMVKMERYKGAMVADISQQEIKEMLYVRANLEGMAAGLACANMTPDDLQRLRAYQQAMERAVEEDDVKRFSANNEQFHYLIFEKSGNRYLYETITGLLKRSWYEPSTSWKGLGDIPLTLDGHRRILRAIETRDVREAREAAEKHILDAIAINEAQNRAYKGMAGSRDA
ncbi:MAG: GntR family transcriptional regulator [Candidatus Limiplasma sp.]|nr:GntR family transcriptional regulator [Candidatus Limiplasma sp.]